MKQTKDRKQLEKLLITEFGGIQPIHEVFYIHSIIFAASRAYNAFDAAKYLHEHDAADDEIFSVIQEALMHVAALSRFFWPVRGSLAAKRGERLREAFVLRDDSVLKQRELRNALNTMMSS